jgi:hypothetical protein
LTIFSCASASPVGSRRAIASAADVGYEWLVKFTHGHIGEPGATKLERLRQTLDSLESRAA